MLTRMLRKRLGFEAAMQRATPGILTLPSCSSVLALAMTASAIRSRAGPPACASAATASETC
jgi:hypothetical protein